MNLDLRRPACIAVACVGMLACRLAAQDTDWRITGPFGGRATTVAVDPAHSNVVLAGGLDSLLYMSQDGAATWTLLDFPRQSLGEITSLLVDPKDSNHYLAGVLTPMGGGLYESADQGKTWSRNQALSGIGVSALAAAVSDPAEFVAGTMKGVMLSSDSGQTWKRISDPSILEMEGIMSVAIDPKDPNIIYAGTAHLPWRTKDGGKTWESIHTGMIDDSDVFSIYVDPQTPSNVYASACSGIYATETRGDLWKKIAGIPNTSRRTHVIREDPAHPGTIYAGTTMGLFRSPNNGITWKLLTSTQVNMIAFDPTQPNVMYLAMDTGIGKTTDGGDTIHMSESGFVDRELASVTVAGNKLVAIQPQDETTTGIFESVDDGTSWRPVRIERGLESIHLSFIAGVKSDGKVLLAAAGQSLFKSVDGGSVWRRVIVHEVEEKKYTVKVRKTPKSRLESVTRTRTLIHTVPATQIYGVWSFSAAGKDRLALAMGDALFFSDDLGEKWRRVDLSGGPVYLFSTSPSGDARMLVKSAGGVSSSTDGGEHWTRAEFPLPMGDINALAVAADGGAPMLIATRVGLYSSPDGGAHWTQVSSGIPASTVSSVSYAATGKSAFAVEYGQLFRSDDGQTWSVVPARLKNLPIRRLWTAPEEATRIYAITSGLGLLFR